MKWGYHHFRKHPYVGFREGIRSCYSSWSLASEGLNMCCWLISWYHDHDLFPKHARNRLYRFTFLNPHLPCSFMLHLFAQEKNNLQDGPLLVRHGVVTPLDGNWSYTVAPISGAKALLKPAARGSIEKLLPFKQKNLPNYMAKGCQRYVFPMNFLKGRFFPLVFQNPPLATFVSRWFGGPGKACWFIRYVGEGTPATPRFDTNIGVTNNRWGGRYNLPKPIPSMYGTFTYIYFTYIWLFLMVKYGKCR